MLDECGQNSLDMESDISDNNNSADNVIPEKEKLSGISLRLGQMGALLTKRFHHNRRDYRAYLSQFILPLAFFTLALVCTMVKPDSNQMPKILIQPSLYSPNSKMIFR